MNVQSKRGGVVHHSAEGNGTPSCNPWQAAGKFRAVKGEVTCKQCIRRAYEERDTKE